MNNATIIPPRPTNEPVRGYAPGSPERRSLQHKLLSMREETIDIPAVIGGERVETGKIMDVVAPHEHSRVLGRAHQCGGDDVDRAVRAAVEARREWSAMAWHDRAAIFLRAADLLAGSWRDVINASTMLGQSKNPFQAEIDSACELIDFFRYNVHFLHRIYEDQPYSPPGQWNQVEYRGLEGFVFAITPFNFTSIAGNLPTAPALMGNTVLWKPASTQLLSAHYLMRLFEEAGLPPGVINMIPGPGATIGDPVLASEHFSGLHFTGSTGTFNHLWRRIGENLDGYRSYPRIVGETGGKDFIVAHESADPAAVATAIVRGAFEYQGQKCSAASRVYVPESLWPEVERIVIEQLDSMTMGPVEDFSNFINAVIDRKSFNDLTGYIDRAKKADGVHVVFGGNYDDSEGFFIEPTVLRCEDPRYETMEEELFGPVASVFVTPKSMTFEETLELVDSTSPYALTGAVFASERAAIAQARVALRDAAGNFYINDKPTGAVVGQQPFGGARGSGTNDKAGSMVNLLRWVSLRAIKETFVPATDYRYPFLGRDDGDVAAQALSNGHQRAIPR
jgi:1-pyrroline-5-carboxylate dehydrogenase